MKSLCKGLMILSIMVSVFCFFFFAVIGSNFVSYDPYGMESATDLEIIDYIHGNGIIEIGEERELFIVIYHNGSSITPSDKKVVEWSSSDENIVTVSDRGYIKGISSGWATIYAQSDYGLRASIEIIVRDNSGSGEDANEYDNYIFEVSGNTITGLTSYGETLKEITIPSRINGVRIFQIGEDSFNYCYNMEKLTLSSEIRSIGNDSFEYCSSLKEIDFSSCKNLTSIGDNTFRSCTSLTNVNLSPCTSLKSIGSYSFAYGSILVSVDMSGCLSLTSIGNYAFGWCGKLVKVVIPQNVTSVGSDAFYNSYQLAEVYNLSSSLSLKGYVTYYGTIIKTDLSEPSSIIEIDGIYYYKENDSSLIAVGLSDISKTSITLDVRTTKVKNYAFYDKNLISVDLKKCTGLDEIGSYAFGKCNIISIIIPSVVKTIKRQAFYNNTNLIIYCEEPSKPSGWDSEWNYSNNLVFWYSESKPTTAGNYWHYKYGQIEVW